MLSTSRRLAVLAVTITMSTSVLLGGSGSASAVSDPPPPDSTGTPEVGAPRWNGKRFELPVTKEGGPGTKSTGPVYTGPTRLELAYQRCEDGGYVAGGVPCKAGASAADLVRRMLADGPGSPGSAAREVVAALGLAPPRIGMTPRPGPGSVGLVGVPSWLWVESPDAQTFGPATATANIDAWTVTVTGRVESVDWDMGDGQVVRCTGPGTPYVAGRDGWDQSRDCGYVYTRQGEFTVTATAHWRVDWMTSDGAQSGTFTTDLVSTVPVTIGEWQVLVTRGDRR